MVSRVWRKVKSDWDAWNAHSLAEEPIMQLILDSTVVRVPLDREATSISLLVRHRRADGQKVLLAIKSMGGESTQAWRAVLDHLARRGLRRPEFLIVGGAPGSRPRSPPSGTACRCSAVPCTSTVTCWRTRLSGCTKRSPSIATTCSKSRRGPFFRPGHRSRSRRTQGRSRPVGICGHRKAWP